MAPIVVEVSFGLVAIGVPAFGVGPKTKSTAAAVLFDFERCVTEAYSVH